MPGAIVIGAGPGIGRSVALRFAREGMPVAVLARTEKSVRAVTEAATATSVIVDVTDEDALKAALDKVSDELGLPDVLVYNAAALRADAIGDLSARGHLDAWAVNVVGAITAAAHLAPAMAERGSGSIIVTSGMPEPKPDYVSLSLGKSGVRTLVTLLDQTYGAAGVHVASVTVVGHVAPGTDYDPKDIAEHYWRLHTQARDDWEHEVVIGPS